MQRFEAIRRAVLNGFLTFCGLAFSLAVIAARALAFGFEAVGRGGYARVRAFARGGTARILAAGAGAAVLAVIGLFVYQVYFSPPGILARDEIVRRVSRESPILYGDGKRQVGSLFSGAHRKYVPLADIPPLARQAIVAAEDQNFYRHHGVDLLATGKAFVDGVSHLSFRRAGSTITQQTVKIVFDDWEHSFRRKVDEALAAFKMEHLYSKDQILEFYLNQFHVTSNGNGIGVAAKYYFDKEVQDLDLVETAFIAGAVKHPTKYNPFTKYTREQRDEAEAAAKVRKDYVIGRMEKEGFITKEVAAAARALPVPFKRGEFRSGDVALVELVRGQLDRPDILAAVGMEDADEFNQAGLRIVTTLDADVQDAAEAAVRKNLVRLQLLVKGYEPEPAAKFRPLSELREDSYVYGKVEAVDADKKNPSVKVAFGAPTGTIDAAALTAVATTLAQASGQAPATHVKSLLKQLAPGAVVFVRVAAYDPAARAARLELARRPEVNGGLIVLDEGDVRAAVPGFDPQGYDRAMQAQRQPGSVFKAVVFHAALELGWSILDQLSNTRQNFAYRGKVYIPHGDHQSNYDEISMLWTGVESENVAAVWLTAHLLDKLSPDDFRQVVDKVGLGPEPGEEDEAYEQRVARLVGVKVDDDGLEERQLDLATAELAPELAAAGDARAARSMRTLWWGRGYESELGQPARRKKNAVGAAEQGARAAILANNYRRLLAMGAAARNDWLNLEVAVKKYGAGTVRSQPSLQAILRRFVLVPGPDGRLDMAYLGDDAARAATADLITRPFDEGDVDRVFGGGIKSFFGLGPEVADARLDGWLPVSGLETLRARVAAKTAAAKVAAAASPAQLLYQQHDFRIAVGLRYLVKLTEAMGVSSTMRPVLSFALGTNVVTIAEVAKIYQTLLSGQVYRFHDDGPANQLNMIASITDEAGKVLYQPQKRVEQLVPPEPSRPFLEILRRVVTNGTGSLLDRELVAKTEGGTALKVPVYGKTGTTNDFTSGSFAGYLPYPRDGEKKLDPKASYVIAAYAGFDRNQSMARGHFRGYGAEVALPAWVDLAKGIVRAKDYAGRLDGLDLAALASGEWPLVASGNAQRVDLVRGLPVEGDETPGSAVVHVGAGRSLKLFKTAAGEGGERGKKKPPAH